MLSDILIKARRDIEYYQAMYPQIYDDYGSEIDEITLAMLDLQLELTTLPPRHLQSLTELEL